MIRLAILLTATLLSAQVPLSGQGHNLVLLSHTPPVYPPVAFLAKLQQTGVVQFKVDAQGAPYSIQADSPLLWFATSAESHVGSWRFAPPAASDLDRVITSVFTFAIDESLTKQPYGPRTERYEISPALNVSVWSGSVPKLQAESCPESPVVPPAHALIASDYVELGRSACYGTCPPYSVRVSADGAVEWDGRHYVERTGRHSYRIDPKMARNLIERFRAREVWNLCGDYSRNITDSVTVGVEITIGTRKKTISDYADSSPKWFQDLMDAVDETADTHAYRHGPPETEALAHIHGEWLPKPGKTELMDVAAHGNLDELRRLLDGGADPNAEDASGWTILMYAAASYSDWGKVELLLERGATPNYVSPHGDTVLMASALDGTFDEDFARRTGAINAQNKDGVSALMLLASRPEFQEIQRALDAGADPTLLDNQGRSALDYLAEENCYRHAVRGRQDHMTIRSNVCDALGDAYQPMKQLLTRASLRWRRRH